MAHQQKTHFCLPTKVRFLNEARLRRMKNEAGLRPMKCALQHMRMHGRDSLHVCEANASWQRQLVAVAASYCQRQCFIDDIQGYALIYSQKCGIIRQINEGR